MRAETAIAKYTLTDPVPAKAVAAPSVPAISKRVKEVAVE